MWAEDKDVNTKAIFAAMNITWAVVKIRPEKIQVCTGIEPMTLCNTGAVLYQLS